MFESNLRLVVRATPETHEGRVVLLLSALAILNVTGSINVVDLCDVVKGDLAGGLRVKFAVCLSDCHDTGVGQLKTNGLGELSPINLRLIPILLEVSEELGVISLIQDKFKLVEGPDNLVLADHFVSLGEAVVHASEVQGGCLEQVLSN